MEALKMLALEIDILWVPTVSRWRNATLPERIPIPPSCARSVGSPPPVVDFLENSNQRRRREWEGRHPSPISWVGSHRKHECEWTLELGVTPTELFWRIDGDVIVIHDLTTSGLCRTVAQLRDPVLRRHKGQRPQQVKRHVLNTENWCFD
jgi:hypothetical protein